MEVRETSCTLVHTVYHRLSTAAVTRGLRLVREDLWLPVLCVNAAKDGGKWVGGNVMYLGQTHQSHHGDRCHTPDTHQSTVIFHGRGIF